MLIRLVIRSHDMHFTRRLGGIANDSGRWRSEGLSEISLRLYNELYYLVFSTLIVLNPCDALPRTKSENSVLNHHEANIRVHVFHYLIYDYTPVMCLSFPWSDISIVPTEINRYRLPNMLSPVKPSHAKKMEPPATLDISPNLQNTVPTSKTAKKPQILMRVGLEP